MYILFKINVIFYTLHTSSGYATYLVTKVYTCCITLLYYIDLSIFEEGAVPGGFAYDPTSTELASYMNR